MRILLSVPLTLFAFQAQAQHTSCDGIFREEATISAANLSKIEFLAERDRRSQVPTGHRTEVKLVLNDIHQPMKTRISVVLMHGLYNSPRAMATLAAHFHGLGMNVINLRLEGHYESDTTLMDSTVRWQQWLEQGREALALARDLGDEVILGGHSTGALTAAWLATEAPRSIRGLVLFAPAIRVRATTRFASLLLDLFDLKISTPAGRRLTGHAAREVTAMSNAYAANWAAQAPSQLAKIPIWLANTPADLTISYSKAEDFVQSLDSPIASVAPEGRAPRLITRVPGWPVVLHDSLPNESNPFVSTLLHSIDKFFGLTP